MRNVENVKSRSLAGLEHMRENSSKCPVAGHIIERIGETHLCRDGGQKVIHRLRRESGEGCGIAIDDIVCPRHGYLCGKPVRAPTRRK